MAPSDHAQVEMQMAVQMAQQERTGFPFDLEAAVRVRGELTEEFDQTVAQVRQIIPTFPDKLHKPKRNNKTKGWITGAPYQKLVEFNPTSRRHIAWGVTSSPIEFDWLLPRSTKRPNSIPKVTATGHRRWTNRSSGNRRSRTG